MSDLGQITAEPLDPMPATDHSMFLDDLSDELIDQLTRAVGAGSGSPLTAVQIRHTRRCVCAPQTWARSRRPS